MCQETLACVLIGESDTKACVLIGDTIMLLVPIYLNRLFRPETKQNYKQNVEK